MSTAFWVLVIAGILILGYCVKKGAEKGLVEELNCILTLICAFIIFRIASSIAGRYTKGDISPVQLDPYIREASGHTPCG